MCDVCEFVTLMGNEEGWRTNLATLILLYRKEEDKTFQTNVSNGGRGHLFVALPLLELSGSISALRKKTLVTYTVDEDCLNQPRNAWTRDRLLQAD